MTISPYSNNFNHIWHHSVQLQLAQWWLVLEMCVRVVDYVFWFVTPSLFNIPPPRLNSPNLLLPRLKKDCAGCSRINLYIQRSWIIPICIFRKFQECKIYVWNLHSFYATLKKMTKEFELKIEETNASLSGAKLLISLGSELCWLHSLS